MPHPVRSNPKWRDRIEMAFPGTKASRTCDPVTGCRAGSTHRERPCKRGSTRRGPTLNAKAKTVRIELPGVAELAYATDETKLRERLNTAELPEDLEAAVLRHLET